MDSKSTHIACGHPLCIRLSGSQAPQRPSQDPQPTLRQQSPLRSWGTSPNSSPQARLTMPTPNTSLSRCDSSGHLRRATQIPPPGISLLANLQVQGKEGCKASPSRVLAGLDPSRGTTPTRCQGCLLHWENQSGVKGPAPRKADRSRRNQIHWLFLPYSSSTGMGILGRRGTARDQSRLFVN